MTFVVNRTELKLAVSEDRAEKLDTKEMIKISQLNKSFGDLHVLKNIDMTVYESDVVCLIGSSGSGKAPSFVA